MTRKEAAQKYNVSVHRISQIIHGRSVIRNGKIEWIEPGRMVAGVHYAYQKINLRPEVVFTKEGIDILDSIFT